MTRIPAGPRPAPQKGADPAAAWLQQAMAHHRAGRLREAEELYRRILARHPDHPDTLNLLGLVLYQSGRAEAALRLFDRAIARAPRIPDYHNNRGLALDRLERPQDAERSYRTALKLRPDHPDASVNLAKVLKAQNRLAEAEAVLRDVLAKSPDFAAARNSLAVILHAAGRHEEALIEIDRALSLRPGSAESHYNRGLILGSLDRTAEAADAFRAALGVNPRHVDAHVGLGNILFHRDDLDGAAAAYRQALACDPRSVAAHTGLAHVMLRRIELSAAVEHLRTVLSLEPDHADAAHNLGHVLVQIGELAAARSMLRKAVEGGGESKRGSYSEYLLSLNYDEELSAAEIHAEHARIGRLYVGDTIPTPPARRSLGGRRLRIGYVSPDFRTHSCAFFIEPLLMAHDKRAVEVFCYASVKQPDETTDRLRVLSDHWRDIESLSDAEAAALIVEDGIDVLVDLAGHTGGTRLGVFALRPAPVQVSWLGYPNTTGLPVIDYRITDAWADPPGEADRLHTEKLARLAGGFLCYKAPACAPEVTSLPMERNGRLTFGSFNNASKIGPSTVRIWSEILDRVPGSRLILKSRQFADAGVRRRYQGLFSAHGVGADRLAIVPLVPGLREALAAYGDIDLALDTFPYNGTTTTCEALWMGVPVVTRVGDRHAARVGFSLMQAAGLSELVATSAESYVELAVGLASDRSRLAGYRRELRSRLATSSLCDAGRFAAEMERALRSMCEEGGADHHGAREPA